MYAVWKNECKLVLIASSIFFTGVMTVSLATNVINGTVFAAATALIILWLALQQIFRRMGHTGDPLFMPLAIFLASIGLIMVLRLRPTLFLLQAAWVGIGLIAFAVSAYFFRRLEALAQYKYLCGVVGIGLLLATILFGVEIGGNKNWIILGPVRFQPSEFAKILIVFFLAAYLNDRREVLTFATRQVGPFTLPHPRFIAPLLVVWGLTLSMLVVQRDLGSALLYFGTTLLMVYLASGRVSYVILGSLLFLLGSIVCYYLFNHVQTRINIWLHPWSDPNGKAYQIIQSLFALGSGGVLGSGLSYGYPDMIPEVHTDFIFAAIGEELGFMGTAAVMLAYMLIIYRAFRTAMVAATSFSALVAGGLSVFMALQILLIIGGVTKFMPLTGITLPWVSYGGSSIVSNFILLGILSAISETRPTDA